MSNPKAAGDIVRALMKNPAARKLVIQAGRKAASSVASVAAKAGQSRSSGTTATSTESPKSDPPPAQAKVPGFKFPIPLGGVGATVETAVNNFAKPVVERMAATGAGRSILSAVNSITSEALKGPSSGSSGSTAGTRPADEKEPEPVIKFVPVQPKAGTTPPPVQTIKWPPPKHSDPTST